MFDFIFKRPSDAPDAVTPPRSATETAAAAVSPKLIAMEQAAALQGDQAAAEFILQCPFADARLVAAQQIHAAAQLETVVQAVRNTDRRVAKLLQGRLDEIRQRARSALQAQQCIDAAVALTQVPRVLPNQVADIDHAWQIIVLVDQAHSAAFAAVRAQLATQLEQQASLQHAVLEVLAQLRRDLEDAASQEQRLAGLETGTAAMQSHLGAPGAAALPSSLLKEIEVARQALQQRVDQHADQVEVAPQPVEAASAEAPAPAVKSKRAPKEELPELRQELAVALVGLASALQAGVLHEAADFDRQLRRPELQALHLNEAERNQLAAARIELARLQDWARWGGNISREELHKAAEALPGQSLAPAELAKKVGSLRERWKSLDASAGAAPREVWIRFDAACSAAYAPAAAHFKKLAEERDHNLLKAQAVIAEVRTLADSTASPEATDWKQLAHVCAQQTQAWQRLGVIERKLKKQLDSEFAKAMQVLQAPLAQRRAEEIAGRQQLIDQVTRLSPSAKGALESLRGLQERWQTQARALPLERKEEQALWLRFRAACDAVFASRKEVTSAADAERRQHQQAKEAICATLEAAIAQPEGEVSKALREASQAWLKAGHVPRAMEKKIEARYQAAVSALQQRLALARRAASEAEADAMRDKLRLCRQAEAALTGARPVDPALAALWQNLPPLPATFERALDTRFQAALKGDTTYAARIEQNRDVLAKELLRCEIVLGLDSPAECSRSRLQLQVEVLQSSLKAGQKPQTAEMQLIALCSLPAATDERDAQRIERIIARLKQNKA